MEGSDSEHSEAHSDITASPGGGELVGVKLKLTVVGDKGIIKVCDCRTDASLTLRARGRHHGRKFGNLVVVWQLSSPFMLWISPGFMLTRNETLALSLLPLLVFSCLAWDAAERSNLLFFLKWSEISLGRGVLHVILIWSLKSL